MEKTNVMRILEQKKIRYEAHCIGDNTKLSGVDVANALGKMPESVFKTLVTVGKSGSNYVFVVPINGELNLKKAAKAVGEKSVEMIKQRDLLPLTGYVHGGCSPIGMKKRFPSYIHQSAAGLDRIFVSAGRVGCQAELAPGDLIRVAELKTADLV